MSHPPPNKLKKAIFLHQLRSENGDDREFADVASSIAELHLDHRGWSFDDAELYRRTLREVRGNTAIPDPIDFAVREVEIKHAAARAARRLRTAFRAAKRSRIAKEARIARAIEKASKSATPGTRTFLQRDLEYVHILGEAENKGYLASPHSVGHKIRKQLRSYKAPHHDHLTIPLRVLTWSIIVHEQQGSAFTFQLGEGMNEKALKSPRGPASFIQERVRDELVKRWGDDAPGFWFSMEAEGEDTRLHVHGGVLPPPGGAGKVLWHALQTAAGKWTASLGAISQVDLKPLTGPYNWASYTLKEFNDTVAVLKGRSTVAATQGIKRATGSRWTALRPHLPSA